MESNVVRGLLGLLLVLFFAIRAYHHRRAERQGGKIEFRENHSRLIAIIRALGGIALLASVLSYFVIPAWVAWADIPLPLWLRWTGLALGYASLPLFIWIQTSLGLNYNTTLHLREGHTMVTKGPYRWVRHPMYSALVLFVVAWFLASANWLMGLPGLLGLGAILLNRVDREEALMIEQFGEAYRDYMRRTGRFLPKLG